MAIEQNPFIEIEEVKELRRESPSLSLVEEDDEFTEENVQFNPTSDGGVEVEFGDIEEISMMSMEQDHYANLAEILEDDELTDIGSTVIENYETDKESRSEWEQIFEHGFDLLGLKLQQNHLTVPVQQYTLS